MTLLLDTPILLWALDAPHKLPEDVQQMLADRGQDVYFSAASIWECREVSPRESRFSIR